MTGKKPPARYAIWSRQANARIHVCGDCFYSEAGDGGHDASYEDEGLCRWCGEANPGTGTGGGPDQPVSRTVSDRTRSAL